MKSALRHLTRLSGLASTLLLFGCNLDVLDPAGSVGVAEKTLITTSTLAMLLVVVPVILLTLFFAYRYRASAGATYRPKWAHSSGIEIVIWVIPALIVTFLAVLTWSSTHELDPYRPIASDVKPIRVQVVALDWKWLFIYPDLGIASVNQLALPVGTPVAFDITSDSVMTSFFIPQLGSQVYAMAGMQTQLHLIADRPGNFAGLAANFSGPGFSDMTFRTLATPQDQFDAWVQKVRASSHPLTASTFPAVETPSEKAPVEYFSTVDANLFQTIVAKYNVGRSVGLASATPASKD
jgi:cytochrome o ubiquinol oxidase subunit II